jgi:HEAT repeat protein/cyclophilin family peptidyl-prolyl cis-trans isomerase
MVRLPKILCWILLFAALAGCAGSTRPAETDPVDGSGKPAVRVDERRFRAMLLQAEDTREINDAVREGVRSDEPGRRLLAVRTAGRLGDRLVLDALDDDDDAVRAEAVFGAGISGRPETLPAIIERAGDSSPMVRAATALALGQIGTRDTLPTLLDMLRDGDNDVRVAACYSIGGIDGADDAVSPLIGLLRHDDEAVSGAATYALSRLSSRSDALSLPKRLEARQELVLLAEHPSPRIRALVAEGLYRPLPGPQADTLANLMRDSDERQVLQAIIRATSFPGAPTFVIHEVTILHRDEHVVLATLRGLARMRGPLVNDMLGAFIVNDGRNWLQAEAIRALGQADGRTAVEVANGLSKDPDPVILAATAESLYGREEPQAGEYAQRLFESTHPWVRFHTLPAMGCVTEHLTDVFDDIYPTSTIEEKIQMARAAGYRLGMSDRPEDDYGDALALLSRLWGIGLDANALALQLAVLDAAASGTRPDGAAALRRGLAAPDPGIRRHAAGLLKTHYDESMELPEIPPRPLSYYEEIVDWAEKRHAAVVTMYRPGYDPGAFTLALDTARTPMTAWAFAQLADQGFYNQRRIEEFVPGLRLHSGRGGEDLYAAASSRVEPVASTFPPGTLAAVASGPDVWLGEWMIALESRPNYLGRYWPFGRVAQFLPGVVGNILPIDRVVSVRVYEGTGMEGLNPGN